MTFIFTEEHLDTMEWEPNSSNIKSVVYQKARKELFVEFLNKKRYKYDKVPKKVVEEFQSAPSAGAFFNRTIKDQFSFTLLPA